MAKVEFKRNQPVQELSGTYGEATFRTLNGNRTIVHIKVPPDERTPRAERVINNCVAEIQLHMGDMREAIRQRRAIQKRVARLYGKYRHLTDNDEQLAKYILQAWYNSRRKLQSRAVTSGQQNIDESTMKVR